MTADEVREWVRGRLTFEAWIRSLHAARDEQAVADELLPSDRRGAPVVPVDHPTGQAA